MCLIIKDGYHIEIAKKDIVTFKEVIEWPNHWEPKYMGSSLHEYNKVLTARKYPFIPYNTIEHLQVIHGKEINEGFHSNVKKTCMCNKICIIPKGSEICYGTNNDIVSLHIIIFKNKLSYLMYKLTKPFKSSSLRILQDNQY